MPTLTDFFHKTLSMETAKDQLYEKKKEKFNSSATIWSNEVENTKTQKEDDELQHDMEQPQPEDYEEKLHLDEASCYVWIAITCPCCFFL